MDQHDRPQQKRRFDYILTRILGFTFILIVVGTLGYCSFFYIFVPKMTGQFCPDFISGHVPETAEEIFLQRVVDAIIVQDYQWLSTVSSKDFMAEVRDIQPIVTKDFKVISGDDLTGNYERELEFENGNIVYLTFRGKWPCPDFVVTEQEVFQRIRLTSIEKRE